MLSIREADDIRKMADTIERSSGLACMLEGHARQLTIQQVATIIDALRDYAAEREDRSNA